MKHENLGWKKEVKLEGRSCRKELHLWVNEQKSQVTPNKEKKKVRAEET